jgi:hypothetical protein
VDTLKHKYLPYVSVNGGIGIPVGSFSYNSGWSVPGANALLGEDINASFYYPFFHSPIRFIVNIGNNVNDFDLNTFVHSLPEINSPISSTKYIAWNLMGGISYEFLVTKKIAINANLLVGVLFFSTPDVKYYRIMFGAVEHFPSASVASFGIKPNFNLVYSFTNKIGVLISTGVSFSMPTVAMVEYDGTIPNPYIIPISVLLVETNLGIVYNLTR